ncbi:DUF4190 domain-containing protein [Cellulomonas oligotrophica]|uniref:DUF4190 domain-containing protein n=1 Tax=Cellulomonas oligotrophica TaxID=931536 RepID=A0A7Y9FCM3_9CELL|nr:DUF4190 domain-containing protein [Cellulomonas oligotrophica]NYD84879.1 hypothetical protein [Cellulomonas oligotrophica]GIG31948.1 hypothetical protein Col01nite_11070 [Cellulomonas oligotrophica]
MSTPQEPRDPYQQPDGPTSGTPATGVPPTGTPYPAGTGPEPTPVTGPQQPYPAAPAVPGSPVAGYGVAPTKNGLGVWSLVLGIASVVLCCLALGLPLGAVAIVLGVKARRATAQGLATNGGMGLAGLILGVVGVLASLYMVVGFAMVVSEQGGIEGYIDYVTSLAEQGQVPQP